ncbi:hypothetical protein [Clostridium novyi]|uniref:hypothetical protein n=1 Tax=Clostridium novyi TaxID=1542 RepID=UPI000689CEA3|nr:hypothetical protein [Clostridium novyi]
MFDSDDVIDSLVENLVNSKAGKIIGAVLEAPEAGAHKTVKKIFNAVIDDSDYNNKYISYDYDRDHNKTIFIPSEGCIVYCKLGPAEHTGICINRNCIVELNGDGLIREVTAEQFLDDSWFRTGINIFIACDENGKVLHDYRISERALNMLGSTRDYNIILDNCHQFTCGCILGDFENSNNFFWMVEDTISKEMNNGKPIKWIPLDMEY